MGINGIPMNKKEESGKTYLYLDKSAFDTFMILRDTGEKDDYGAPIMKMICFMYGRRWLVLI